MNALSPRQRDVLAFMLAFCVEHRRAPGRREVAARWRAYEEALRATWEPRLEKLAPGLLGYGRPAAAHELHDPDRARWDGEWWIPVGAVVDGSTLICACPRARAAAGCCHRVIAADLLKRAGWSVVLDGRSL